MIKLLCFLFIGLMPYFLKAHDREDSLNPCNADTLNSFLIRKNKPVVYSFHLKHKEASIGNKLGRGSLYVSAYNITMGAYLLIAPEYVSKWNKKEKFKIESIGHQFGKSFTSPPVIDKDLWFVNYIGHPYQGGFYYNALRSQGTTALQSSLFCIGHSFLWEYGWEAGMEQPSIQDLLSTPLAGILVGELSHVATLRMSRNGFSWYEIIAVCLINPVFAINNGFRSSRTIKPERNF